SRTPQRSRKETNEALVPRSIAHTHRQGYFSRHLRAERLQRKSPGTVDRLPLDPVSRRALPSPPESGLSSLQRQTEGLDGLESLSHMSQPLAPMHQQQTWTQSQLPLSQGLSRPLHKTNRPQSTQCSQP